MGYWDEREQKQREALFNKTFDETNRQVSKQYRRTKKVIERKMSELFDEIQAKGEEVLASDLYKYNKYYDLIHYLDKQLTKLGQYEIDCIEPKLEKMYKKASLQIDEQFELGNKVDTAAAERAVKEIWCNDGKHWSQRIWKDKALLARKLEDAMIDAVSRGATKDELVKDIMNDMNVSYNNANRIIRTELSNVQNKATIDKFKEAGIEEYQFLATPSDDRCCDECRKLNGKRFGIESATVGVNFPVMHPNCRCTILAVTKGGKV